MIEKMREDERRKNKCKILYQKSEKRQKKVRDMRVKKKDKGKITEREDLKIEESTRHEVKKKDKGKITEWEDLKIEESTRHQVKQKDKEKIPEK